MTCSCRKDDNLQLQATTAAVRCCIVWLACVLNDLQLRADALPGRRRRLCVAALCG